MEKKIVAIDCDDVVVETTPVLVRSYNKAYGTDLRLEDAYSTDLERWGVPDQETAVRRWQSFLNTDVFLGLEPTQEAVDVIHELGRVHDLHIVTGRSDFIEEATLRMLERHFPDIFRSVVLTNYFNVPDGVSAVVSRPKNEVCVELGADYLIDDHLHHAEITAPSVEEVFLFGNYPWNQTDRPLADNIRRVSGWREVGALLLADAA